MNRNDKHSEFHRHYRLPGDYFQTLESRMQQRLAPVPRRIHWRRRILQVAAVLLVGLVAWPLYRNMHPAGYHTTQVTNDTVNLPTGTRGKTSPVEGGEIDLSDIPDEVIDEYLLMDDEPLSI